MYECFKEYIPSELQVDHKDNNKLNNCIDNLQLLTPLENITKSKAISIVSVCIETGQRKTYPSMRAASRELKVNSGLISKIVRNESRFSKSKRDGLRYKFEKKNIIKKILSR